MSPRPRGPDGRNLPSSSISDETIIDTPPRSSSRTLNDLATQVSDDDTTAVGSSSEEETVSERDCPEAPPGFVREPGPATRRSQDIRWPHGVLNAGTLIKILEDLSQPIANADMRRWKLLIWLQEYYITPFGRAHNSDGLVVQSEDHKHMLFAAQEWWITHQSERARGDIFWVPGLEPLHYSDGDDVAEALSSLPEPPVNYGYKPWLAGEVQYRHGTYLRTRKGTFLAKFKDGTNREWNIWTY